MVTETERQYMWDEYAKDPRARINLGIRAGSRRSWMAIDGASS
jgi:hypothetical protein